MRTQENSRALRHPRRHLAEEVARRNERLKEGLEELWEPDHIADSEDALNRALRDLVSP